MKQSAGILLFRRTGQDPEVLLVHPGGPFFARKNNGWWTVPKGEIMSFEEPLDTAIREFEEETGMKLSGNFIQLTPVTQKGGKKVYCWALEGDFDVSSLVSNTFETEWPPKSGKMKTFPEIDKAQWFNLTDAETAMNAKQVAFLMELTTISHSSLTKEEKNRP